MKVGFEKSSEVGGQGSERLEGYVRSNVCVWRRRLCCLLLKKCQMKNTRTTNKLLLRKAKTRLLVVLV